MSVKTCSHCNKEKDESEFARHSGKPLRVCLECNREYYAEYMRKRREIKAVSTKEIRLSRNKEIRREFDELRESVDVAELRKRIASKYNVSKVHVWKLTSDLQGYSFCQCGERIAPTRIKCDKCKKPETSDAPARVKKESNNPYFSHSEFSGHIMVNDTYPIRKTGPNYAKVLIKTQRGIAQIAL